MLFFAELVATGDLDFNCNVNALFNPVETLIEGQNQTWDDEPYNGKAHITVTGTSHVHEVEIHRIFAADWIFGMQNTFKIDPPEMLDMERLIVKGFDGDLNDLYFDRFEAIAIQAIKDQKLLHKTVQLEQEVDRNRMTITASRGFSVDAPVVEIHKFGYKHSEINNIKSYNDHSMPWFNLDCYKTADNSFIVKVKKIYLADPHNDSILVWGDAETAFNAAEELVNCRRTTPKHDSETLDKLYTWLKPHF